VFLVKRRASVRRFGHVLGKNVLEARSVVQRWQALTGKQAALDEDGRTFEQVAQQRRKKAA
jgi:hypothetical protein